MLKLGRTVKVVNPQILVRVANLGTVPILEKVANLAKVEKVANLAKVEKAANLAKVANLARAGKVVIVDLEVNSHIRDAMKSQEEQSQVCLIVFNIAGGSFKAFNGCIAYNCL